MIQKGMYPYEYMDGWKKFEETSLPLKDAFYCRLIMMGIIDQDHEHAQQVWNTTEKNTWGCYQDTYLKTCFAVGRCVLVISKYVLRALQVGSSTFLHHAWISIRGLVKDSR